jgi:hypothetical protein
MATRTASHQRTTQLIGTSIVVPGRNELPILDNSALESNNSVTVEPMLFRMSEPSTAGGQLGALFAASGIACVVLLLVHPHERTHAFSDIVEFEIRNRLLNEFVHGGAIALFLLLLAGHVALARLLSAATIPVTVAVIAFGGGCAFITASLALDGFVIPALALQYHAAQDLTLQQSIEGFVRLCGTSIRILMPMALLSFAASALAWCPPLLRAGGGSRFAGAASGAIGAIIGATVTAATPRILDHAVLGSLLLVALWHLALAVALVQRTVRLSGR